MIAAAGLWVLYTHSPAATRWYPHCVFHAATGLNCPGCGGTRALYAILHGRVGDAFRLNPLLFLAAFVAACAVPSLLRGKSPQFLRAPWFGWSCVVIISAFWIVRNTPLWPW